MDKKNIVVIGNGMTGYKYCEKFVERGLNNKYNLIVFGEEPTPAYDRVHLTSYYSGVPREELLMAHQDWYLANKIQLFTLEYISKIDLSTHQIISYKGKTFEFHKLVLATGSSAFVPQVSGVGKNGIFVYRTLEDLDAIKEYAKNAETAAVIGGGLLGLEAARAVMEDGLKTSVVEFATRLMPRQLDEAGASFLQDRILDQGIDVLLGKQTKAFKGNGKVEGLDFSDGSTLDVDMVIISAGIRPRDELARSCGLKVGERGGIVVDDNMLSSSPNVYAIGECALAKNMIWGLVAPCYDMAEVAVAHLDGEDKSFKGADMSTKLKLIGTDVASFGDALLTESKGQSIVFENRRTGVYKRINISEDGNFLLGGILVGDASDYNMLVQMTNLAIKLPPNPENIILGSKGNEGGFSLSVLDLPDEAVICSCENVSKGKICCSISDNQLGSVGDIKKHTKAGTGCGGCVPMIDDLLKETFKSQGKVVKNTICEHFDYTRQELYDLIKIKGIKTYKELLHSHGKGLGCEICKPLGASLLASIWNDLISKQSNIQDTNDRYLANIQRGGTYSVVPRIPGGEIVPEKLIVIGEVAKKYDLYCKITGGQRIDLFGAHVHQLPQIWEELINAGFESGHAYGKSLRTVKSCVGSNWCRFGQQDSVSFAIEVEERYKGLRSPHKLKGGVSGCIRECAEARGKDFGIIATEKGWNLYVCGNGGANPKHAILLASDIDNETCMKYLDRFLMFYIKSADPLTRTSKWLEKLDGGISYLKEVVVDDCLGIANELESEMQLLVDTFACEWKEVVNNPELRKRFTHFVNSSQPDSKVEFTRLREQKLPLAWKK